MAARFFRCTCGKLHVTQPTALLPVTACECGRLIDILRGVVVCGAAYGDNPDPCYQPADHPETTHTNRYGTTWSAS